MLGERMRLACGTRVVAWRTWLAEGTKGISPRVLCVPAPSSDFSLGEVEEPDEREEGDDVWVPPLSGYGEGGSWLGRPTREQA
jgi:hypothetical protein